MRTVAKFAYGTRSPSARTPGARARCWEREERQRISAEVEDLEEEEATMDGREARGKLWELWEPVSL